MARVGFRSTHFEYKRCPTPSACAPQKPARPVSVGEAIAHVRSQCRSGGATSFQLNFLVLWPAPSAPPSSPTFDDKTGSERMFEKTSGKDPSQLTAHHEGKQARYGFRSAIFQYERDPEPSVCAPRVLEHPFQTIILALRPEGFEGEEVGDGLHSTCFEYKRGPEPTTSRKNGLRSKEYQNPCNAVQNHCALGSPPE